VVAFVERYRAASTVPVGTGDSAGRL
jgi:hypothetical protein